ncbi:hypothetical protein BN874_230009 [Candidatus Contendobacter odensis Run_B_J11]|uniref:Uncharacterized protein n=1 Tax=Candidatus Contendobacter odensis Run_B_J11 TaxID=1400861 RepID=A0A7U7GBS6_9GAMM|nr:hypothetical protein BN874_230009 [Candidatus Contendobacter odensis Run_B_J11]
MVKLLIRRQICQALRSVANVEAVDKPPAAHYTEPSWNHFIATLWRIAREPRLVESLSGMLGTRTVGNPTEYLDSPAARPGRR